MLKETKNLTLIAERAEEILTSQGAVTGIPH